MNERGMPGSLREVERDLAYWRARAERAEQDAKEWHDLFDAEQDRREVADEQRAAAYRERDTALARAEKAERDLATRFDTLAQPIEAQRDTALARCREMERELENERKFHALDKDKAREWRDRIAALEGRIEHLASEVAAAQAHRQTKGGQQVPFHGDFASATPSVLTRLEWHVRALRAALQAGAPAAQGEGICGLAMQRADDRFDDRMCGKPRPCPVHEGRKP